MKDPCPASISGICLQLSTGWPHACPEDDICDEEPWNAEREWRPPWQCGAISGTNVCQRSPHGTDIKHEDMGTYWGPGKYAANPAQLFYCTGCEETFNGRSVADEPCCACSCIDKDNGGCPSARLRNGPNGIEEMPVGPPHWLVFREFGELDKEGVSELLGRVGYQYPRTDNG